MANTAPPVPRAGNPNRLDEMSDRITEAHGDRIPDENYYTDEPAEGETPVDMPDAGDLVRADWHLRTAQYWERIEQIEGQAVADVLDDIKTRWAARREALRARQERHLGTLELWHRQEVASRKMAKTMTLPSGVIGLKRSPRPRLVVTDPDAFRAGIAAMTTDAGESVEELAYPTVEKPFSITALESAIGCRPTGKDRGEAGTKYPIRDPDTGQEIDGAHYIEGPDQWSAK